jgi:hypothetical protein
VRKIEPDERIVKLSYAKFEEEFGFRPKNKVEQNLFALKGRKPDARILTAVEKIDAEMKKPPPESEPLP